MRTVAKIFMVGFLKKDIIATVPTVGKMPMGALGCLALIRHHIMEMISPAKPADY